jgi:hypothetical protein
MAYTFPLQQQITPDWCWNAVAVSTELYFNPSSTLTQDGLAIKLGLGPCDPDYISPALDAIAIPNTLVDNPLTFAQVKAQLDLNLPVCVHIAWPEGGSHYVVISGYTTSPGGSPQVYVCDTILPEGDVWLWDFEQFTYCYGPSYAPDAEGQWIDTSVVTPPAA